MGSGSTKTQKETVVESRNNQQQRSGESSQSQPAASTTPLSQVKVDHSAVDKAATEGQTSITEPGRAEVFISYQWDKQRQVRALYNKLTGLGYSCWMDLDQMGGGDSLYDKIEEGITGCRVFLSCVTAKYAISENCRREVSVADGRKKPIIPLKMDTSPWPPPGPMAMIFGPKLFINFCRPNEDVQLHWNCPQFQELIDRIEKSMDPQSAVSTSQTSAPKPEDQNAWHKQHLKFAVRLDIEKYVTGIAFIDKKICVVCEDGDAPVKMYADSPPHNVLGEIPLKKVDQVQIPQDLIASKDTGLLYVATTAFRRHDPYSFRGPWLDPYIGYVWSMRPTTVSQKQDMRKVIAAENGIDGISMTSGRLLVTPSEPLKELHVYDVSDGRLLKKIELTVRPYYGVETDRETYLVCVRSNEKPVIEVDSYGCPIEIYNSGKIITNKYDPRRTFQGQIGRLVADGPNGCVLAIEVDDERVIMLNNKLQFDTVLLTKLQKVVCPVRMCYGPDLGMLAIAGKKVINVYTIRQQEDQSEDSSVISRSEKAKLTEFYKQTPRLFHCYKHPNKETAIMGVAHIDGKVCFVCNVENSGVSMFADKPPHEDLGEISLGLIENQVQLPQDLVASEEKGTLYVATNVFRTLDETGDNLLKTKSDIYGCISERRIFTKIENHYASITNLPFFSYVWSVRPTSATSKDRKVTMIVELDHGINGISQKSGRLLVTTLSVTNHLLVYDVDNGRLLKKIDLDLPPYCAVETNRGTYFVCSSAFDSQICEVGDDGCVIKSYRTEDHKERLQKKWRVHLKGEILRVSTDTDNNCLLAVEYDEKRVLLVNSNLQLEKVLLTEMHKIESPRRICFISNKRMLAVAGANSVTLYSFQ